MYFATNVLSVISYIFVFALIGYVFLSVFFLWQRKYLNTKYPPINQKEVDDNVMAISGNVGCKTLSIKDVEVRIPEKWDFREGVMVRGDCLIIPPPGLYMHWRIFKWGYGKLDSPSELMAQVERQAFLRRWVIRTKNMVTIDDKVQAIDVVAEARNGVTHRYINFCHNDHEYFCEMKADTPSLFVSAKPIFDECINTFRLI